MNNIKCKYCTWVTFDTVSAPGTGYRELVKHVRAQHTDQFQKLQRWLRDTAPIDTKEALENESHWT